MKKKILLFVAIMAMLICVLAISVSADSIKPSTSNEYGELTTIDGVAEPKNISKDAKAVVVVNGTYYTIPTYYLIADNTQFTWSVNSNVEKALGVSTGENAKYNVVRIEVPYGIVEFQRNIGGGPKFESSTALIEASLPTTLEYLGQYTFGKCPNLSKVIGLENTKITELPKQAFYQTKSLSEIKIPSTVTVIYDEVFKESAIQSITIPAGFTLIDDRAFQNCSSLKTVTFAGDAGENAIIDQAAFENCTELTEIAFPEGVVYLGNCICKGCSKLSKVTFPTTLTEMYDREHFLNTALTEVIGLENTQLERIPQSAFKGLKTWTPDVIQLPNTVTTIDTYALADVGVKKVILGANVVSINNEAFTGCKSMTEFVLPGGLTTINFNNSTARLFFVTSTDTAYLETIKSKAGASDIVSYAVYSANPSDYASGKYVISGYNVCDAFYDGEHTENDNPCVINCDRCDDYDGQMKKNPQHNYVDSISYANYLANGTKTQTCQSEGCVHKTTPVVTDVAPIISSFKGYSIKEDGNGLTFGYTIDYEALEEYVSVNGKSVELGFVVAAKSPLDLEGKTPLNENGNAASEKVIKATVVTWTTDDEANASVTKYTGADFKITGSWTAESMNAEIYMAGYIIDATGYAYLNYGGSSNTADYTTYNTVLNAPEED